MARAVRPTIPGPWKISREQGLTECEEPHPVRLGRGPYPEPDWRDRSPRAEAIRDGRQGYYCPGSQPHTYPVWIVYNSENSDPTAGDMFDHYPHAVNACDEANALEAAR